MQQKRGSFSSCIGFVLAAAGSAVGLGNIWRFPYLAAKYGGGMFMLIYVILVCTFGYALMIAENAIGRKSGRGPLNAFASLNKKWGFVGVIATLIPCIILPYYNVIGGWIIQYFAVYLGGFVTDTANALQGITSNGVYGADLLADVNYFGSMLKSPWAMIATQTVFTGFVVFVLLKGVKKGVEKASAVLMPILIVLAIAISIYTIFQPGAIEGVKYLFIPKFENFSVMGVLAAMGQMFYSLSLAMGIMIAYGSYMPKNTSLEGSVTKIEICDTAVAVLAGLMIIPALFIGKTPGEVELSKGPGLMFEVLPGVFNTTAWPNIIGMSFFFLVFAAAITSAISLMEAVVASVCDHFKISRKSSVIIVGIVSWAISCLPALGYNVLSHVKFFGKFDILDFMDFITNSVMMPICALLTCLFVTFGIGTKLIEEEVLVFGKFKRKALFNVMIKYIAPILVCAVLAFSVLEAFGLIKV